MDFLRIFRFSESDAGSFGAMKFNEVPFCVSLEPDDNWNQVGKSQIPPGQYICERYDSPTFGPTWKVLGVPGRTDVLFHWGNRAKDTKGCIILGQYFGTLYGEPAVMNSKETFDQFMLMTKNSHRLHLTITEQL